MDWLSVFIGGTAVFVSVVAFVVSVWAFSAVPPRIMRDISRNRGPRAMFVGGMLASLLLGVMGAFIGVLGAMFYSLYLHNFEMDLVRPTIVVGIAFTIIAVFFSVGSAGDVAARIRRQKALAQDVSSYGLQRFHDVLAHGDGIIRLKDLKAVPAWESNELLWQLFEYIDEIGHVIDFYTTHGTSIIMVGGVTTSVPSTTIHNIYGISKTDLETYPPRIAKVFARW